MLVAQDPAGTTPERTGVLCFVCNRHNSNDRTSQNLFSLWSAAVARRTGGDGDGYLRSHYWTNAMMHGVRTGTTLRDLKPQARSKCSSVLKEQVRALSPEVVIACGEDAAASLFQIGLLRERWSEFKHRFSDGAHAETITSAGFRTSIYCTYHTAESAVNRNASRLYSPRTEELLGRRQDLEDRAPVRGFLEVNPSSSTKGRGMRVLLLHWLDIGAAIRSAHEGRG